MHAIPFNLACYWLGQSEQHAIRDSPDMLSSAGLETVQ